MKRGEIPFDEDLLTLFLPITRMRTSYQISIKRKNCKILCIFYRIGSSVHSLDKYFSHCSLHCTDCTVQYCTALLYTVQSCAHKYKSASKLCSFRKSGPSLILKTFFQDGWRQSKTGVRKFTSFNEKMSILLREGLIKTFVIQFLLITSLITKFLTDIKSKENS